MKRLIILLALFATPVYAAELPASDLDQQNIQAMCPMAYERALIARELNLADQIKTWCTAFADKVKKNNEPKKDEPK